MIWIDFDDIWQKYSEGSRIEFACFIFHVGLRLLVMTLSSLKPHAENRLTRALHAVRFSQIRYDTIEEINVDSKAEYTA